MVSPAHESEQALLGAVLSGYRGVADLAAVVMPGDFDQPAHEAIWRAILEVFEQGQTPDPLTVRDALRNGARQKVDPVYLADLMGRCPLPAQAMVYARQVSEASKRRQLQQVAVKLGQLAGMDRPVEELIEDARAALDEASRSSGRTGAATLADILPEVLDRHQQGVTPALPTPWKDVDELTGGLHPGTLVVVGARPSVGKSLIAANIAADVTLRQGACVYVSSLEMSRGELVNRIISAEAKVNLTALMHSTLTDSDWERIAGITGGLMDAGLLIDDSTPQTVGSIRAGVRDASRARHVSVAIIDYLQLLAPRDGRLPRQEQVAEMSRGLKLLAREQDLCVIALAQVNRAATQRSGGKPTMADLRESGAIEADADQILLLHRDDESPETVEVIVAKNRNGAIGERQVLMQGHYARLVNAHSYPKY
jgi:replicative DNA helicase